MHNKGHFNSKFSIPNFLFIFRKLENVPIERTQHDDTTSILKLYLSKAIPRNSSGQLFFNFSSSFVEQDTEAFFKTSYNTGDEGSGERSEKIIIFLCISFTTF